VHPATTHGLGNHADQQPNIHAMLNIRNLGPDLAQADRASAQPLSTRAALHAGSGPQMAREASALKLTVAAPLDDLPQPCGTAEQTLVSDGRSAAKSRQSAGPPADPWNCSCRPRRRTSPRWTPMCLSARGRLMSAAFRTAMPTFQCSFPPNSSWRSISRPPRRPALALPRASGP
jgi:hypothetical protein